jgi:GT2 family glycosyltransferase
MNQPLVTVNILSFNRKDDLRVTLQKVFEQDYKNIEVIVVDNNSTDGTIEMVKSDYPQVQLIELKKNIGIAGWNEGFKAAKGEYVLVLDDDSYPENSSIYKAICKFTEDKKCGGIAFNIFNLRTNEYQTKHFREGISLTFIGCGALFRKIVFEKCGYFRPELFIYLHEEDFSIRMADVGWYVSFMPSAKVIHISSMTHREINKKKVDKRRYYYLTRNILIILILYFPLRRVLFRIIRIIAGRIIFGLKNRCFLTTLRGILTVILIFVRLLIKRRIISREVQHQYQYGKFFGGFYSYVSNQ